jgi:hypothetical protein
MKKRRLVDSSKLIEAVESGQLNKELISKFGLEASRKRKPRDKKTNKDGPVSKQGKNTASRVKKEITISARGSLIVPREIVTELGFELGDSFQVQKIKAGISLKKA